VYNRHNRSRCNYIVASLVRDLTAWARRTAVGTGTRARILEHRRFPIRPTVRYQFVKKIAASGAYTVRPE
jgi:hypothetical protein